MPWFHAADVQKQSHTSDADDGQFAPRQFANDNRCDGATGAGPESTNPTAAANRSSKSHTDWMRFLAYTAWL
jgi:hypothetical protein